MPNKFLEKLIESMVGQILLETSPEAPKNSIAGEYLWADPMNGVRRDDAVEKDSKDEVKALRGIQGWYITGLQGPIKKALPVIQQLVDEGHYKKYFNPPNTPMYRWLSRMEPTTVAKVFNLDIDELLANKNQVQVFGPGTLRAQRGKSVTSWTVEPSLEMLKQMSSPRPYYTTVLVKARPNFGGNNFLLNPTELLRTFDPELFSSFLEEEMETIAVGDVHYESVVVLYIDKALDSEEEAIQKMIAAI